MSRADGSRPHQAAVRRAVDRLDPAAADARRKQAKRDIALIRSHYGDGMGELFARMTSEDVELVWLGADAWARRQKTTGDERTFDQLRVAALVDWAESFLTTGEVPCGQTAGVAASGRAAGAGEPAEPQPATGPTPPAPPTGRPGPPRRHGRPITLNLSWDLTSFLGLTDHSGEILGPGVLIPPEAMRDLIQDAELRRLIYHPLTGHLLDATPFTVRPSAPLAAFCALRDIGPFDSGATAPRSHRVPSVSERSERDRRQASSRAARNAPHSPTRRWHRARTLGGWTVIHNPDQHTWTWTSPAGRTYTTRPHDYRLGP